MNKKLELEFSELLIAAHSDNVDRMGRILNRLDFIQREYLARALLKALYPALYYLPEEKIRELKKEFQFETNAGMSEEEVAACQ